MPETPQDRARKQIDAQLEQAGWIVQNPDAIHLAADRSIAAREFALPACLFS